MSVGLVTVDVWIPIGENQFLNKVTYHFDTDDADAAKKLAVEEYLKKEVPKLLAVSWTGPIDVKKVVSIKSKKPTSKSPRTSSP